MNSGIPIAERMENQGFPLQSIVSITNKFLPARQSKALIYVSSATPLNLDGSEIKGKVGKDIDIDTAKYAACLCLAHSLSLLRQAVYGSLDDYFVQAIDLTYFINASPTFERHSDIADAGSNLLITVIGPAGEHCRSAIGVASLVRNVSIVLKGIYEVKT